MTKQYVFTEQERVALLDQLELAKIKARHNQFLREDMTVEDIAETLHRSFHYIVARAFNE